MLLATCSGSAPKNVCPLGALQTALGSVALTADAISCADAIGMSPTDAVLTNRQVSMVASCARMLDRKRQVLTQMTCTHDAATDTAAAIAAAAVVPNLVIHQATDVPRWLPVRFGLFLAKLKLLLSPVSLKLQWLLVRLIPPNQPNRLLFKLTLQWLLAKPRPRLSLVKLNQPNRSLIKLKFPWLPDRFQSSLVKLKLRNKPSPSLSKLKFQWLLVKLKSRNQPSQSPNKLRFPVKSKLRLPLAKLKPRNQPSQSPNKLRFPVKSKLRLPLAKLKCLWR
ncbi:hypothetical protein DYB30_013945 [Aphanomyces astaci]|uniref:Uncharacterized protein n=1 Tax=Aphanomyces astaci TaxID=112090 RepID=A0A397EDJ7_APHAT|nr:hypothetical protein DYB30_013945 [Aphanomyces astaci]